MNLSRATLLILVPVLTAAGARAEPPVFTATAEWNSNATNSDRTADVIGALQFSTALEAFSGRLALGHDDALVLSAGAQAEAWPRFDGLDQLVLGPALAWRHKFGLGALAPVLSVELGADGIAARESDRSGFAGRARLVWSQRVDDATRISLSYERTRQDARESVYDRTAGKAAAEVSYAINESWQAAAGVSWRQGDVVSYATPPRPDLVALARVRTLVDTFGATRVAYAVTARTLGGWLAFTRPLDERSSLTLRYEELATARGALRYGNHLVSTAFTHQF